MSWIAWTLSSAVFLALYDLCKKASVRDNAVLPVLLCSTLFGCAAFTLGLTCAGRLGSVVFADGRVLTLAGIKALIVATSWIFTFTALRTLPVTIATPIRASSPALVFLVALFLYGEIPTLRQGFGMLFVFAGYWAFSWAGRAEGIDFLRSHAVWCAVAGAGFSALSSLYDKYVFQIRNAPTESVQFYFQVGLVVVYAAALAGSLVFNSVRHKPACEGRRTFQWRWTIPFVGILLALADWLYFHGLAIPEVPVSVVALLRRFSVVITFVLGAFLFHEHNLRRKGLALASVLLGVILLCL